MNPAPHPRVRRVWPGLIGAVALAAAGPCCAQAGDPPPAAPWRVATAPPAAATKGSTSASLRASGADIAFALSYDQPAAGMSGFARTALDHRFSPDHVTGSVGYLCGLHAGPDGVSGPAASSDPVGTFLGAKLSYAF